MLEPSRTNLITQSEAFDNPYWTKSGASIQGDPSTAGSELVTNGSFATDSGWIKETGWSISGGKAVASPAVGYLYQNNVYDQTSVKTYKLTYDINVNSGTFKFLVLGSASGTFLGDETTSGTYTVYFTTTGNSGDGRLYIAPQGSFNGSVDNVSLKEVQGFTSPDGTTNAYKVLPTASGTGDYEVSIYGAVGGQSTSAKTNSFFVKPNGQRWVYLAPPNGGSDVVFFDLQNGVIGTEKGVSKGKIETYPNGWYRLSLAEDTNINYCYFGVGFCDGDDSFTYTQSSNSIFLYGGQYELGSYATSYIPTQGSAVTRVADTCSDAGNEQVFNDNEGVLYLELEGFQDTLANRYIKISSPLNSFTDALMLQFRTNGQLRVFFGTSAIVTLSSTFDFKENNKIAVQYDSINSSYKMFLNGVSVSSSSVTNQSVSGLSKLSFNYIDSSNSYVGNVKDVKYYNTTLIDAELIALTQV